MIHLVKCLESTQINRAVLFHSRESGLTKCFYNPHLLLLISMTDVFSYLGWHSRWVTPPHGGHRWHTHFVSCVSSLFNLLPQNILNYTLHKSHWWIILFEWSIIDLNTTSQSGVVWGEIDPNTHTHSCSPYVETMAAAAFGSRSISKVMETYCSISFFPPLHGFTFILKAFAMCVDVTPTQIHPDRADRRWESEEGRLSRSLLNPTWQMPNLQDGGSGDKTGKGLMHKYFSALSKTKAVM